MTENMQARVTDVISESVPSTEVPIHHVLACLLENLQTPAANIGSSYRNTRSEENVTPPTTSIIPHTI